MTVASDRPDLLALWRDAIRAGHEASVRLNRFNMALSEENARLCVPPGHSIDYLGDGKVKPTGECAKVPTTE